MRCSAKPRQARAAGKVVSCRCLQFLANVCAPHLRGLCAAPGAWSTRVPGCGRPRASWGRPRTSCRRPGRPSSWWVRAARGAARGAPAVSARSRIGWTRHTPWSVLVGDDDGDVVLVGKFDEAAQHLVQLLLALGQLAAAAVVDAEERDDRVDDLCRASGVTRMAAGASARSIYQSFCSLLGHTRTR